MSGSIKMARAQSSGRAMPGTGYRGDPGLFGFLGGVAKGLTGVVGGLGIPGISTVASIANRGLSAVVGGKTAKQRQLMTAAVPTRSYGRGISPMTFASTVGKGPSGPGSITFGDRMRTVGQAIWPGGVEPGMDGKQPKGYHLNKSGYYIKTTGEWVEPFTRWVKDRRRNPLNPRAWDRAYGRLKSANNFKKRMAKLTFRSTCS